MASPTLLEKFMRGVGLTKLTCSEILLGHGPRARSKLEKWQLVCVGGWLLGFCFVWRLFGKFLIRAVDNTDIDT